MRTKRNEQGQAVTAVAVTAMFVVVAATLGLVFTFGKGTSELSTIQSGADAAALAGAQDVADSAWQTLDLSLRSTRQEFRCGDGRGRASTYASRNSTALTTYCYFPEADRVEVTTRSTFVTETGRRETARSVAELGQRLGPCTLTASSPPPKPSTLPTQPRGNTTARCGDITVDVRFDSAGDARLATSESELNAKLQVTLAG
ncbi:MAG: hypothetical protein ACRCXL_00205 [Dermatophilaceae bacterium]